ncbi:hypothetical protein NPIL_208371 [Nephila pilipes]|uniref:Uncharacterized protein n=1 Tax=Nephila pilipes TaxID=299642 RepID=A0A8X6TIT1_NEPPI|nr:hypothetical protein NPIL_208371 [Nephila pilipes]
MASGWVFHWGSPDPIDILVHRHKKGLDSPAGPRDSYRVNGAVDGKMGTKWSGTSCHTQEMTEEPEPGKQALKARRSARLPRKSRGQVIVEHPCRFTAFLKR